jgi:serine/tyrosine/threonine adenylyltransferase
MISTDPIVLPLRRPSFADLAGLFTPWRAAPVPDAQLVVLNEALAVELGLDVEVLRTREGLAALAGQRVPAGTVTIAQAYAGHQFGGFSPSLGDGRALLLGEIVDSEGRHRDVHLKGSGATPYSRGGDGKATLGPMLREHLVSEAMHALRIPTTRALAVVATGEPVVREVLLPGAILVRVAGSHLRVGSFQYAAAKGDADLLKRLADHAISRHYPAAAGAEQPYVALLETVAEAQAALVAQWMLVGFVHGVMNTDNMAISGETIDYGPCAFMEAFDPATVFSSIDHSGRYAYAQQPRIAHWNLARFAEALLPLLAAELEPAAEAANGVLASFAGRYDAHWLAGMRAKMGLTTTEPADADLVTGFLAVLEAQAVDMTSAFRALSPAAGGDDSAMHELLTDNTAFDAWAERWRARLSGEGRRPASVAAEMDRTNPTYVPRNQLVEDALAAAVGGDMGPYVHLLDVVTHPFDKRSGDERYALPSKPYVAYRTFCGT